MYKFESLRPRFSISHLLLASMLAGLIACAGTADHPTLRQAQLPDAIRIKDLFFNLKKETTYKVSPDGRKIAWIGEKKKKRVIFFKTIGSDDEKYFKEFYARYIYHLNNFEWAMDSRHILYRMVDDNSRQVHLYARDTEKYWLNSRDLTPWKRYSASIHRILPDDPEHILVSRYMANQTIVMTSTMDLIKVNIHSGRTELVADNSGHVIRWITDRDGHLRGRVTLLSKGNYGLEIRETRPLGWRTLKTWRGDDQLDSIKFPPGGDSVFYLSNLGRDKKALIEMNLNTKEEAVVCQNPEADIMNFYVSPKSNEPVVALSYPDYPKVHILEEGYRDVYHKVGDGQQAGVNLYSIDREEKVLTAFVYSDRFRKWILYNRESGDTSVLSERFSPEMTQRFSKMKPIVINSGDGLTLPSYLTLPEGAGRKNLPMVVYVHGGPWSRDYWGFNSMVQFLANRGYAVLQINYRGSRGFGRNHEKAAVGEFARKMHTDLIDGVNWAIAAGIADPEKIAIFGYSYGGYAAMVGMTFTPRVFACGININGPSNLISVVSSKDVSDSNYKIWYKWHQYVGDPENPDDRDEMKARSPFFHVDQVQNPLLIIHGAKDQRVPKAESDEMVKSLKQNGKEVKYIVFPRENHSFHLLSNQYRVYKEIESFLAKHLGGRKVAMDNQF